MNIGGASKATGVSVKMIRYYESIGLIAAALRSDSGYRVYSTSQVHTLRFIGQARNLGFSVEQMSDLLELWRDRARASGDVKTIATHHISTLQAKAQALQAMSDTLQHLVDHCHGDGRPDCPILESFAGAASSVTENRAPRFGITGIDPDRSQAH